MSAASGPGKALTGDLFADQPAPQEATRSPQESTAAPVDQLFALVAVPLPLPEPLTYAVPEALAADLEEGCRVRVEVGRRRVLGVVVGLLEDRPDFAKIKEISEVLDLEPAVPRELLDLARFAADYYLAPIGEAVRLTVPADLPPWGDRRISLTDAGALAPRREEGEAAVLDFLMEHRRCRLAELRAGVSAAAGAPAARGLARRVETLARRGWVSVEEPGRRFGSRYVRAVELAPGSVEAHRERARSAQGKAVVDLLKTLGRPATVRDVTGSVGCGAGVIRRLVQLGIVREFTQPARLALDRHRLSVPADGEVKRLILRPDQAEAVRTLEQGLEESAYLPCLLFGVTGSGKTEVYLRAVEKCLQLDRGAILMVPEIALVPALASAVRQRFGQQLALLHSNLGSAERQQEWERIRRGEARVVLGPRSALFAPVARLGLVVVDEEHDSAYKQDRSPRYSGRDMALWRAREAGAVAVLASATPSLESRYNAAAGKLKTLRLTERAGHGAMPEGILVDLRKESAEKESGEIYFSGRLLQETRRALEAGDQVIFLRNRRGYAPVLLCRACGEDFRCPDCGLAMTFHLKGAHLACHYCGYEVPAPRRCPACDEASLEPIGAGTERVEERFRELFPGVGVDVLDADASRRAGGAAAVLERFSRGESQALIGTQMVAKGHHFPRVALAAVLFADTYLKFPDFRAVERTYALLTQLAGRAGRGDRPGKVIIQTYHPTHYAIEAALAHDDAIFAHQEMRFRKVFGYPPFSRMVLALAQNKVARTAEEALKSLATALRQDPRSREVRLRGPVPAPFERLRGKWRFQLVLRGPSGSRLRRLVGDAYSTLPAAQRADLTLDVDPYDLL
ncbi:MAG: primosomal protein N' [Acidobacteriota bacterium]